MSYPSGENQGKYLSISLTNRSQEEAAVWFNSYKRRLNVVTAGQLSSVESSVSYWRPEAVNYLGMAFPSSQLIAILSPIWLLPSRLNRLTPRTTGPFLRRFCTAGPVITSGYIPAVLWVNRQAGMERSVKDGQDYERKQLSDHQKYLFINLIGFVWIYDHFLLLRLELSQGLPFHRECFYVTGTQSLNGSKISYRIFLMHLDNACNIGSGRMLSLQTFTGQVL